MIVMVASHREVLVLNNKGNSRLVSWYVGFSGLLTLIVPQIIVTEGITQPILSGDILGIILFLVQSILATLQIAFMFPSILIIFLIPTSGILYMLFKDIIKPIISGIFSNTVLGVGAGLVVGVALLGTLLVIVASLVL